MGYPLAAAAAAAPLVMDYLTDKGAPYVELMGDNIRQAQGAGETLNAILGGIPNVAVRTGMDILSPVGDFVGDVFNGPRRAAPPAAVAASNWPPNAGPPQPEFGLKELYELQRRQQRDIPRIANSTATGIFDMRDFDRLGDKAAAISERESAMRADAAGKTPLFGYEDRYKKLLEGNKLEQRDPLRTRALSDAVLAWAGKMMDTQGHGQGALSAGVDAWTKGRDREETRDIAERDRRHKMGMEGLGMSEKDFSEVSARDKAILDAAIATATGGDKARMPYTTSGVSAKQAAALKMAEINKDINIANLNAQLKRESPLTQHLQRLMAMQGKNVSPQVKALLKPQVKIPESVQAKLVEFAQTDQGKADVLKQWISQEMSGPQLVEATAILDNKK